MARPTLLCPQLPQPEPALLCFLGEMQGPVLGTVAGERGGQLSCFHILKPALLREGLKQFCSTLRYQHGPRWHPRPGTSPWTMVLTDPHCCRAMDPDMDLHGNIGHYLTMTLGGISGYAHQAVSHYPRVSRFLFLHCTDNYHFIFLFHFFTTYLFVLMVPGDSECLGSSQA